VWNVWGIREVHREFWWGSLRQRYHLEEVGAWKDNIKMDLKEK